MKLKIIDDLNPEDVAMLQALYSRSAESVDVHLGKVQRSGSSKFMDNYVVQFNHKSIADTGSTTLFIEGVSILAAKAIQDSPLYNGQETSTRYIDMAKQAILDPIDTPASKAILDKWMSFYVEKQEAVAAIIRQKHPRQPHEDEKTYDKAVKARTFDVLRGFLPAGITTQLSWHTNLRQAGDHLSRLIHHPLAEIKGIAIYLRELLAGKYTASGFTRSLAAVSGVGNVDSDSKRLEWERLAVRNNAYPSGPLYMGINEVKSCWLGYDDLTHETDPYKELLSTRPRGAVLPHFLTDIGQFQFEFLLDFGSFRDLQRHRNGVCRMPLLETGFGFHRWYLDQLSDTPLYVEAFELVRDQAEAIIQLPGSLVDKQYVTALGFNVPCQVTYALPALIYVLEMRSSKTVHPTLRQVIHKIIECVRAGYPPFQDGTIALHVDMDLDDWDIRRGKQTIVDKNA